MSSYQELALSNGSHTVGALSFYRNMETEAASLKEVV